jgi:two-component system response regulator PilR (NtrC family)
LFRSADGGTVFLDEIAELPMPLQVKLLRVLQERVVKPVGGVDEIQVDVRVIAATNRDLEAEVQAGRFREDLFYRLNVLRIELPPLRERVADVEPLARHFLRKYSEQLGRSIRGFAPAALQALLVHEYPGNVRELANAIERAVALTDGELVEAAAVRLGRPAVSLAGEAPLPARTPGQSLDEYLDGVERRALLQAVGEVGSKQRDLAHYLGITERSLRYRLGKHRVAGAEPSGEESPKNGDRG